MSNKVPDLGKIDFFEIRDIKESKSEPENNTIETIKTLDGILDTLDDNFIQILDKVGLNLEDIRNVNRWYDIGLDDYDEIELIMGIEKIYNCNVLDVAADEFTRIKPSEVWNSIIKKRRDSKISKILN